MDLHTVGPGYLATMSNFTYWNKLILSFLIAFKLWHSTIWLVSADIPQFSAFDQNSYGSYFSLGQCTLTLRNEILVFEKFILNLSSVPIIIIVKKAICVPTNFCISWLLITSFR